MHAVRSIKSAFALMILRPLCLSISVFISAFLSTHSLAEEQLFYTIDMIVIKHLTQTTEETWPKSLALSYPEKLTFLDDGKQTIPAGAESLKVNKIDNENTPLHQRIKSSRDFRVIYHQSWVQYIQGEDKASNIAIRAGSPIEGVYPIAGSIKLFKSRYLHLRSNLWFIDFLEGAQQLDAAPLSDFTNAAKAANPDVNIEQALQHLWPVPPQPLQLSDESTALWSANIERISQIKQKRRMRSNEVHYIDHPLYGIILEIRPL